MTDDGPESNIHIIISKLISLFNDDFYDQQLLERVSVQFIKMFNIFNLQQSFYLLQVSLGVLKIRLIDNFKNQSNNIMSAYQIVHLLVNQKLQTNEQLFQLTDQQLNNKYQLTILYLIQMYIEDSKKVPDDYKQFVSRISYNVQNNYVNYDPTNYIDVRLIHQVLLLTYIINQNETPVQYNKLFNYLLQAQVHYQDTHCFPLEVLSLYVTTKALTIHQQKNIEDLIELLKHVANNKLIFDENQIVLIQHINIIVFIHSLLEIEPENLEHDQIKDICQVMNKIIQSEQSYNSIYVKVISTLYSAMQLLLLIKMKNNIIQFNQIFIILLQNTVKVASSIIQNEKQNDYLQKCCLNYLNYYIKFTVWCKQKQIPIHDLNFPEYGAEFSNVLCVQTQNRDEQTNTYSFNIQEYLTERSSTHDMENVIYLENSSCSQYAEQNDTVSEMIAQQEEQQSSIDHLGNLIQNILQNSSSEWVPKTRQEIIQKTEVIVYLQNLIPLNGHLIKHYSNTEFPSLILEMYIQMFSVEPIPDDQMLFIMKNPNTRALADTIYLFLNYESAMKQLILTNREFFVIIQRIITWVYVYLSNQQYDINDLTTVLNQLELFIEKFYCAWEQLDGKFVEILILYNIIQELVRLFDHYIIIDKYVSFSKLIMKFLLIAVEYNMKYSQKIYLSKIELNKNAQWQVFQKFVSDEEFYMRIKLILEYYMTHSDKYDNVRYICCQLIIVLTQLTYYKDKSIVLDKIKGDKVFYLEFIQQCYKYVFDVHNIVKYPVSNDDILYQFVSMCAAVEVNSEGYQIFLENIYKFEFIHDFVQQISQLQFSKIHDRILELLTLVYYRCCDKMVSEYDNNTKLNSPGYSSTTNTAENLLISKTSTHNYNSLINLVIFQIWSIFKYNLSLYAILFQMPYVFEILQQSKYGNFLINVLIIDGYIGCQIRPVKQSSLDELTQQIVHINSIIESYDSFTDQQVITNSRIDYDFVKLSYLLCLQELKLNKEIFEHIIFQPHYKLLTLVKKESLIQYVQSSVIVNNQEFIAQKVKYILQQSLISRVNIYFILCLYKYLKKYKISLQQFCDINIKNINDLITISNFWDFNDNLAGKFIVQENENVIAKYQVLYPNKQLDGIHKTIKNYLSDVVLSYNIYHDIQQTYMYPLQHINIYYAIFKSLVENDVIQIVQQYDYYEIPLNFSKYVTVAGKMIEQLYDLQQQDINEQQQIKLRNYATIIQEQQLNCYIYIHQIMFKIISNQSNFYMYDQTSSQIDMTKYIKKSLMFLELSLLNNEYISKKLYETVLKLTDQKFDQINYVYDSEINVRRQRINFNIQSINNSQYDKIVYQFNYKDNIELLSIMVNKLFDPSQIDAILLKIKDLSKYISVIPTFKITINVQQRIIQLIKQSISNESFQNMQLSENESGELYFRQENKIQESNKQDVLQNHVNILVRLYKQNIQYLEEIKYNAYRNDTSIESEELTQLLIQLTSYINNVDFVLLSFKYVILLNSFRTECDATLLLNNNYHILEKMLKILASGEQLNQFLEIIASMIMKLQQSHQLKQTSSVKQNIETNMMQHQNHNIVTKLIENDPFYSSLENTFLGIYDKEANVTSHIQQQNFDRNEYMDSIIPYYITRFIKNFLLQINKSFQSYINNMPSIADLIIEITKLYTIIFILIEDEVITQIILKMLNKNTLLQQKAFLIILNIYQSIQYNMQHQQEDTKIQDYNISRNIINQFNLFYLAHYNVNFDDGKLLNFVLYQKQELISYHQDIRSQNIDVGNFIAQYNSLSIQQRIQYIQDQINTQISQFFSKLKLDSHEKAIFKQKLYNINKNTEYQFKSKKLYRMFKYIVQIELKNNE